MHFYYFTKNYEVHTLKIHLELVCFDQLLKYSTARVTRDSRISTVCLSFVHDVKSVSQVSETNQTWAHQTSPQMRAVNECVTWRQNIKHYRIAPSGVQTSENTSENDAFLETFATLSVSRRSFVEINPMIMFSRMIYNPKSNFEEKSDHLCSHMISDALLDSSTIWTNHDSFYVITFLNLQFLHFSIN